MEIKRGDNCVYLGNSQEEFDGIMKFEEVGKGLKKITHTIVKMPFVGKGVGEKLAEEVVAWAREDGFKLEASCEYAKKVLSENDDYKDVYIK